MKKSQPMISNNIDFKYFHKVSSAHHLKKKEIEEKIHYKLCVFLIVVTCLLIYFW